MENRSLFDRYRLSNLVSSALRLSALDHVWTSYLNEASTISGAEMSTLRQLVDEMEILLLELEARSEWLATFADSISENSKQHQIEELPLCDERKRDFLSIVHRHGGISPAMRTAALSMRDQFAVERRDLTAKMAKIYGGGFSRGDLSQRAKCIIGWVCVFSEVPQVQAAGIVLIVQHC